MSLKNVFDFSYHNCGNEADACLTKVNIEIPDAFVSSGPNAEKVFDAGTIDLNNKFADQSRRC